MCFPLSKQLRSSGNPCKIHVSSNPSGASRIACSLLSTSGRPASIFHEFWSSQALHRTPKRQKTLDVQAATFESVPSRCLFRVCSAVRAKAGTQNRVLGRRVWVSAVATMGEQKPGEPIRTGSERKTIEPIGICSVFAHLFTASRALSFGSRKSSDLGANLPHLESAPPFAACHQPLFMTVL